MQLSIDNEAARKELRKLSIRRDGFQPYSILQGPSDDNVRVLATLVETPAAVPASKAPVPAPIAQHAPKPAKPVAPQPETSPQPAPPTPSPAPAPNPGDIRLQR